MFSLTLFLLFEIGNNVHNHSQCGGDGAMSKIEGDGVIPSVELSVAMHASSNL